MDIEQMIQDNMGLVYKQLHKFDLAFNDDALSYAMESLWNAAKSFDPSSGTKFSTYATTCIYNGIMRYFRESASKLDTISYEAEIENDYNLVDKLASDTVFLHDNLDELYTILYRVVDKLSKESHKQIVRVWIESNFEITQTELSKQFKLTQAAVSRVIVVYKYKLKQELEEFYETSSRYY